MKVRWEHPGRTLYLVVLVVIALATVGVGAAALVALTGFDVQLK